MSLLEKIGSRRQIREFIGKSSTNRLAILFLVLVFIRYNRAPFFCDILENIKSFKVLRV